MKLSIKIKFVLSVSLLTMLISPVVIHSQEKYDLVIRIIPGAYDWEIIPGQTSTFHLEVRNSGNPPINDITFYADAPRGWTVQFEPASIETLLPGSSQVIRADVTPASGSSKGDYNIMISAGSTETRTATSVFLRIESGSNFWTYIGIGIVVLVICIFIIIFLRYGTR